MIIKIISSKTFRWVLVGLYAGLICLGSSTIMEPVDTSFFLLSYLDYLNYLIPLDKCLHFIEYGVFCTILCWAFSVHLKGNQIRKFIFIAISLTSLYGITDEVHQLFVPTRTGTVFDWFADTLGAIIAGLCWLKFFPGRKARKFTGNRQQATHDL